MAKQKTVQKIANKPKTDKKRRTKEQIDRVKKRGDKIANIAGAIIALSSIKWEVSSQTAHDVWYVVSLCSLGMICQCRANAGGKMICKHVCAVYKILEKEWWYRARKKIKIRRHALKCVNSKCASKNIVCNGKRKCKRKKPVQ